MVLGVPILRSITLCQFSSITKKSMQKKYTSVINAQQPLALRGNFVAMLGIVGYYSSVVPVLLATQPGRLFSHIATEKLTHFLKSMLLLKTVNKSQG